MPVYWIWLCTRPGLSDWARVSLMEYYANAQEIYRDGAEGYCRIPDLPEQAVKALEDKDLTEAMRIENSCCVAGIQILTWEDPAYPERLRNIPDPPMVLYYRGTLPRFDELPAIGVVGTRKASGHGLLTAKHLGIQITQCGGLVISGMAKGIDAMATEGALLAGNTAVGVLGCGVDIIYPASNRELYEGMYRYGCLISEYPPGTRPSKWRFPRRNRIISGLSCGVLVVEAPQKSGALITARQALEQGRDVFAVPGNIVEDSCSGSNALLREGAIIATSGWDVMSEYQILFPDHVHACREEMGNVQLKVAEKSVIPEKSRKKSDNNPKNIVDNGAAAPYSDVNKAQNLTGEEATIAEALADGPCLVDDLIERTGLPAARVLTLLTMLEIRKIIHRLPGRKIALRQGKSAHTI